MCEGVNNTNMRGSGTGPSHIHLGFSIYKFEPLKSIEIKFLPSGFTPLKI